MMNGELRIKNENKNLPNERVRHPAFCAAKQAGLYGVHESEKQEV